MRSQNGPLYAGAVVAALLLGVVAWLFGISPRTARQADANEARDAQVERNAALQKSLDDLIAENKKLPEYIDQIYAIRDDLPPTESIPEWRRTVNAIFEDAGLVVLHDNVSGPVAIEPDLSIAAQAKAVGIKSPIEGLKFNRLVATPFEIQFAGDPAQVFRAIDQMQYGDHRYFLMSGLSLIGVTEDSDNVDLKLQPGDVTVDMSGYIFTLDYGRKGIQTRPVEEPTPDCIEPPEDGSTDISGGSTVTTDENGDTVTTVDDPLPYCEDTTKPKDFNPFVPFN